MRRPTSRISALHAVACAACLALAAPPPTEAYPSDHGAQRYSRRQALIKGLVTRTASGAKVQATVAALGPPQASIAVAPGVPAIVIANISVLGFRFRPPPANPSSPAIRKPEPARREPHGNDHLDPGDRVAPTSAPA